MRHKLTTSSLIVILCVFVLVLGITSAQDEDSPYEVITPDNVDQLVELFSFTCEGDTHDSSASFFETTFVYGCFLKDGIAYRPPTLIAYSLERDRVIWRANPSSSIGQNDYALISDTHLLGYSGHRLTLFVEGEMTELQLTELRPQRQLAISSDTQLVAVLVTDEVQDTDIVRVYTLPDLEPTPYEFMVEKDAYTHVAFSHPEQGLIGIADSTGLVQVYEMETGELVMAIPETPIADEFDVNAYDGIIFSPDGSRVFVNECTFIEMGCWSVGVTAIDVSSGDILGATVAQLESYDFVGFVGDTPFLLMNGRFELDLLDISRLRTTPIETVGEEFFRQNEVSINREGTLIAVYHYGESESVYRIYGVPRSR